MPVASFDKKDDIPKGFEDLYEENEGKFVLKTSKLETTLEKVRDEKKAAEKRAKEAEDERADLQRKLAAASTGEAQDKVAKALAKFDEDLAKEKEKHKQELATLQGELRTIKLDDRLKESFIKAGGRPEKAAAALELTKKNFDLADNRIVVKNEKGEVTTETAEDYYGKKYRNEMPEFYQGTKATGGGANGGAGKKATPSIGGRPTADEVIADPLAAAKWANENDEAAA